MQVLLPSAPSTSPYSVPMNMGILIAPQQGNHLRLSLFAQIISFRFITTVCIRISLWFWLSNNIPHYIDIIHFLLKFFCTVDFWAVYVFELAESHFHGYQYTYILVYIWHINHLFEFLFFNLWCVFLGAMLLKENSYNSAIQGIYHGGLAHILTRG